MRRGIFETLSPTARRGPSVLAATIDPSSAEGGSSHNLRLRVAQAMLAALWRSPKMESGRRKAVPQASSSAVLDQCLSAWRALHESATGAREQEARWRRLKLQVAGALPPYRLDASEAASGILAARNKKDGSSKKKGGGGGDDDGGDDAGGADSEEDKSMNLYRQRITQAVVAITVVSVALWVMSWPYGAHFSWREAYDHADEIEAVSVYNRFAQLTLAGGKYAYVGLTRSTQEIDAKLRQLLARRKQATTTTTTEETGSGDGTTTTTGPSSGSLTVEFRGESWSENLLHAVGVVAWVMPFVFVPLFVMLLSQTASIIVRDSAKAAGQMGSGSGGKSLTKNKLFAVTEKTNVRFNDIAGMTESKHEITEIVDFLKSPDRYQAMGAKIPSGAMLLGPPGTGKTMLAKAVAGEADVPFIPCCGSDFVELYVGMGALRVRQLFELARAQPKCIIYIDEIDAIGTSRKGGGNGEQSEQEHTLNELLTQLDGFQPRDKIIVLASSNVELSMLDSALVRPGRFDRIVNVDSPVIKERIDIFNVHLRKLRLLPPEPTEAAKATASAEEGKDEAPAADAASDKASAEVPKETKEIKVETAADKSDATPVAATAAPDAAPAPGASGEAAEKETLKDEEPKVVPILSTSKELSLAPQHNVTPATDDGTPKPPADGKTDRERKIDELVAAIATRMSNLCPGFVGADIANVCNEGAILAAREKRDHVQLSDLERSIDRVLAGIEHRSRVLSDFEKNVVAHHEAGHAVAGWFLNRADPLMKVSIVPRGGSALGYAQYLPSENNLKTADDIEDSICVALGGRVAEIIFFDHLSTGASDDLRKVTKMAYAHVASFGGSTAHAPPGTSRTAYMKPYGEKVSGAIDNEALRFVERCFNKTHDLLLSKKKDMEVLAKHLLENEVLTHEDVVNYLGARSKRQRERKYV